MNRRRVQGIRENNGCDGGSTTVLRILQQQCMRWWKKMSTKTTTTITKASAEDRRCVQGIGDNNRSDSGSTTSLVDWQRKWRVDFPCYRVSNSNTVLTLSRRCLVSIFFHQIPFSFVHCNKYYQYCNHAENIFAPSVH